MGSAAVETDVLSRARWATSWKRQTRKGRTEE